MPRRGYRKGVSDAKAPRPHVIKSRATRRTYARLHAEADSRSVTFSTLVAEILDAHVSGTRPETPQPRGLNAAALRELTRIGNNLNQIAHQANVMRLPLIQADARRCLAAVLAAIGRL